MEQMKNWYNYSWTEVVKMLNSDGVKGISEEAAIKLQMEQENNKNKGKYNKKINELSNMKSDITRVLRAGVIKKIPSEQVVIGDIVFFQRGDIVSADARIIECENLKVNEEMVSGEKAIVDKFSTKIEEENLAISLIGNMIYKSSMVIRGEVTAVVVAVGKNTEIGAIVALMRNENNENRERFIIRDIMHVFYCSIGFSSLLLILFILNNFQGLSLSRLGDEIIKIFVVCTPLVLPIAIIVNKYVFKKSLLHGGVRVNKFSSLQRLANINLVVADKFGVFSERKMRVKYVFCHENISEIVNCKITNLENKEEISKKDNFLRLLSIGILSCRSNKKLAIDEGQIEGLVANGFLDFVIEAYEYEFETNIRHKQVLYLPYDKDKRIVTSVNKIDSNYRANVMGEVEFVLNKCTHIMVNGIEKEIVEEDYKKIREAIIKMANEGLEVQGFAYRNFTYEPTQGENIESNLVFVGVVGFINEVKDNVIDVIERSGYENVRPLIISNENKLSAFNFVKKIGLSLKQESVLSGIEIDNMLESEFEKNIETYSIFTKIQNIHKYKIIKNMNKLNYKILLLSDKVLDLPALAISHCSILMGNFENGLLKSMCDFEVMDAGFDKIMELIEGSRKIMVTSRKILDYSFCCTVVSITSIIVTEFLGMDTIKYSLPLVVVNSMNILVGSLTLASRYKQEEIELPRRYKIDGYSMFYAISSAVTISIIIYLFMGTKLNLSFQMFMIGLNQVGLLLMFNEYETFFFQGRITKLMISIMLILNIFVWILDGQFREILRSNSYWMAFLVITIANLVFLMLSKLMREK